ncbi:MAG: hypothetical protein IKM88_02815 [Lachnospiraceae bacterium]|nr:hypothetical protein [Lachnospiraceae bacterium]
MKKKMNGMRSAVMAVMVIGTLCACTNNTSRSMPVETTGAPAVENPVTEAPVSEYPESASPEAEIPVSTPGDGLPYGASPEVELPEEIDEHSKELIMNALSCEEKEAESILRQIDIVNRFGNGDIRLSLKNVEKVEEGSEYWDEYGDEEGIVIEDASSVKYYLMLYRGITGGVEVYEAKNLDTDEIVFAVYE